MADILLSYERTDRQRVAPIVAFLETNGWSVASEPAGESDAALDGASPPACVIAAWSIDSVESDAVWAVAGLGLASGTLVSVSIDFSRPPQEFNEAPSLALAGWTGDASSPRAQELLNAVGDLIARAPARASAPAHEPAPAAPAYTEPPAPATRASIEPPPAPRSEPEPEPDWEEYEPEPEPEPEPQRPLARHAETRPEPAAKRPPAYDPLPKPRQWHPLRSRLEEQAEIEVDLDAPEPPPEPVPAMVRRDGTSEPVWAFPEDAGEEEQHTPNLPPVLLRERGMPSLASAEEYEEEYEEDAPAPAPAARRSLLAPVLGLAAALAIVAAAGTFWMMGALAPPGDEVAAVETPSASTHSQPAATSEAPPVAPAPPDAVQPEAAKPREARPPATATTQQFGAAEIKVPRVKPPEAKPPEVQPTPAALPKEKDVAIEDILGQVTPRVEQLLTDARQLMRIGDFRAARQVLTGATETAQSGSLTFLLAETYDPNVLPATLKGALGDPGRARSLYRKARDLGDGRAQGRLDALKMS